MLLVGCARACAPCTVAPVSACVRARRPRRRELLADVAGNRRPGDGRPTRARARGIPARVHVSYHWLWLVPREALHTIALTVPYHDGIRTRAAVDAPLAPGARVDAAGAHARAGRSRASTGCSGTWWRRASPGLRRSRRASRARSSIVLPTLAWLFAPLPLLIALAGCSSALARRGAGAARSRMVARIADVALVRRGAGRQAADPRRTTRSSSRRAVAYWLIVVAAVVPPVAGSARCCRGACVPWMLLGIGMFGSLADPRRRRLLPVLRRRPVGAGAARRRVRPATSGDRSAAC